MAVARAAVFLSNSSRDRLQLRRRAAFAAKIRERDAFDRAVAADANRARKQRVARNLSRHAAAIELKDDFVFGDFADVIGVGFAFVVNPQFSGRELQFLQKFRAFPAIEIENRHRFVRWRRKFLARAKAPRDDCATARPIRVFR